MYELNDRVNQLYFGILLIDEQLKQNILLQQELERNYRQIESYMINGIANQSDLDAVKVEQINARQRNTELQTGQDAYLRMLGAMIRGKDFRTAKHWKNRLRHCFPVMR